MRKGFFIVLSAVLAGVVAAALLQPRVEVSGTEFSPDLFTHRSFRYEEHPWFGYRLSPVETRAFRSPLEEYLHRSEFIPEFDGGQPRWVFIKGFRSGVRGWSGEAKPMCHALDCFSGRSQRWVTWSETHPTAAKTLWPKIVYCAQNEMFGKIGGIMYFVREDPEMTSDAMKACIELVMTNDEW